MTVLRTLLLVTSFLALGSAQGAALHDSPHLRIRIVQNGRQMALHVRHNGTVQVALAGHAFEISYPKGTLSVCASMNKAIYTKAKVGTDALRDFNSCMLVYKSTAMPAGANYLPLSSDSGFALDAAHGAKSLSRKRAVFRVAALQPAGKGASPVPLRNVHKDVYLVMWMDSNRNKVIDPGELERWDLHFH